MKQSAIALALAVGLVFSSLAAGTNYTWKATAGGNWTNVANWTPSGYPQAGDDANFTGTVAQTVYIAKGNQTVNNLSVTGSATWLWNASSSPTFITNLTVSGTFTHDATGTNNQFNAPILGNGALVVNSGRLMLCPALPWTNDFSSIIVNGGTLTAGSSTLSGNTNHFGAASTVVQVGAPSGTNDATVEFSVFSAFYPQPILIRSGSSGRATLRYYNRSWAPFARLGGGITLQKDVHLASAIYLGQSWWNGTGGGSGHLDVISPITGTGDVYLDDIGNIKLTGTNSYMGQTIVNANHVWVMSDANTSIGAVRVIRGNLYANNDGALGAPANTLTLGGPGTMGALGLYTNVANAITPVNRSITLAGNGGIISGWGGRPRPYLNGPITGPGKLIIAHTRDQYYAGAMYGANDYSGGTMVVDGCMRGGTNTAFGTGDIELKVYGSLGLFHASNVGAGAKIIVKRNPLLDQCGRSGGDLGLYADFVPAIATNSNGKLAINFSGSTNVNAWLANGSQPIGDGTMFLGSWNSSIITATGLAALVVNDPTHTYKLGTSVSDMYLDSSNGLAGALADIGGQPYNVQVGRPNLGGDSQVAIFSYDKHGFSGTLSVYPGSVAEFLVPGADDCMGHTNGNIVLYGCRDYNTVWRSLRLNNNSGATRTVRKNDLRLEGSVHVSVDANSWAAPTYTTTLQVATLTRSGRSTLALKESANPNNTALFSGCFGTYTRFIVTNGVPTNNGMVAPWIWHSTLTGSFLDYGATGFITNLWDGATLAGATATAKISLGTNEQIPAGGAELYALRMTNNIMIRANGPAALTNHSGGVLLSGAYTTNEAPLEFGTNEAVVIASDYSSLHSFIGQIRGSGGLTKTGSGRLWLSGDNSTLSGNITVNQGQLLYTNWISLGTNTITLNGGELRLRGTWAGGAAFTNNPAITNNIIVGPCGGILGNADNGSYGRYYGSISGPGWLRFVTGWGYYVYGVSTYSGGTYVGDGFNGLNLYTNDALGTGPLHMGGSGNGTDMNNYSAVVVLHDRALNTNTFVEMRTRTAWLFLQTANPQLGSLEGNGFVTLGTANLRTRAAFGLDNRDADYFGQIDQQSGAQPCTLVKGGSGTWTLWGLVTLNGGVVVTNGTLCVNNWVNTEAPVVVYPGATLTGIGTVGVVTNLGGTVKGNLHLAGLSLGSNSVLEVALNGPGAGQHDVVTVNGPLNLTGGALVLTLNFKPTPGQTFTILNNTGGSISGQFASGQTVSGTYNGQAYGFRVTYDSGNNIVLTALSKGTVIGLY
jgi:autotransporter-associated beta strand protein